MYDDSTLLIQFKINDNGLEQLFSTPLPASAQLFPRLVLDRDLILMRMRNPDVEREIDPRVGLIYRIVNTATGNETDVTPTNMEQTTPWVNMGGVPILWSDELGLTQLLYESATRQVNVWQGKDLLENVQQTPPIIGRGDGIIDGRYTRAEITEDGVLLAFNWETGRLEAPSRYAALGTEIAKVMDAPRDKPFWFTFAQEIAVVKNSTSETHFTVVSSDGSRKDIKRIIEKELGEEDLPALLKEYSRAELYAQWNALTDSEKDAIIRDALLGYRRDKGFELPLDAVAYNSYCTPIDDSHVGILDINYQRLIKIGIAEPE